MKAKTRQKLIAAPYTIWMIGFIVIPLFFVAYYAFVNNKNVFTLENILYFGDPLNLKSFALSLELALVSTIICIILAYPIALIFRNSKTKKSSFLVYIFILPMWMNGLLRLLAWLALIEKNGLINTFINNLNSFLSAINLRLPNLMIENSKAAVILGMVYDYLPFMILPLYNSLMKINEDTLNGARDLGANEFQVFTRVIFPLSMPGIISGVMMVFIPSLTTVAISDMLGGGKMLLIGNMIERNFSNAYGRYRGAGLSMVLVVFIFIVMGVTNMYTDKDEESSLI